jgi:hypothetical protein
MRIPSTQAAPAWSPVILSADPGWLVYGQDSVLHRGELALAQVEHDTNFVFLTYAVRGSAP